ncbi:MAG: sensor histidine kinase [Polyangiaceae bacterium]
MGARTLEASLRIRLLAVLVPLLLGVFGGVFWVMHNALYALEVGVAREHAASALRLTRAELAEGDDLPTAMREVLLTADASQYSLVLRSARPGLERAGSQTLPADLRLLSAGECRAERDERARGVLACAESDGTLTAIVAVPTGPTDLAIRHAAFGILGVLGLALAGATLAVRRAVRRSTRQVAALAAWSRDVSSRGRATPAPVSEAVEVAQLGTQLEEVMRKLFEALERERAQSAHIAHELRTPLTAIRAELEVLAARGEEAASRALADAAHLSDVIEAILILAAPSDARAHKTIVNLADLVRQAAPGPTVLDVPDEALIEGDSRLLDLALRNLIGNAEHHACGVRGIRIRREGRGVRVSVLDEGPGLDEAQRARMFERYWRGTAQREGYGLGLALVRAVAERHGGRAEVRARSPAGLEVSIVLSELLEWSERSASSLG